MKVNFTKLVTLILFLVNSEIVVGNDDNNHWVGKATKYLKVEYSLECVKHSNSANLIIKYTNISNELIGFSSRTLGLSEKIVKQLNLIPLQELNVRDKRGRKRGINPSDEVLTRPQDNNLDYYVNKSKTLFVRYSVTDNHYFDPSIAYQALYAFSFTVKEEKIAWFGDFGFILNAGCFENDKLIWHNVGDVTEGVYIRDQKQK